MTPRIMIFYTRFTDRYGNFVGPAAFFSAIGILGLLIFLSFGLWILNQSVADRQDEIAVKTHRLKNHEFRVKQWEIGENVYKKSQKQGFFHAINPAAVNALLEEIQGAHHPNLLVLIEVHDPKTIPLGGGEDRAFEIPVTLNFEGNDDRPIYDFLELIQKKMPGIVTIQSIGLFRDDDGSEKSGSLPLIRGEVQFVCLYGKMKE